MPATLQANRYWGTLAQFGLTEMGNKTPTVWLEFNVTHVAGTEAEGAGEGGWVQLGTPARRTVYLFCSDGAWLYTEEKLGRLGFNGMFGDGMDFGEDAKARGVALDCAHEEYQGQTREKWDLAYAGANRDAAPEDVQRLLTARWRQSHAAPAAPPAGKPRTPESPLGPAGPVNESDIPF